MRLGRRAALAIAAVLLLVTLAIPALASASNRRISISNYRWSDPDIHINKGEHVSWYWIGPDLMHSVTGNSANTAGLDSDPQTNQPHHKIGDTYQVTFDQPGTYDFVCKLHPTVHGEITVSNTPGDATSEPDPVPKSQVDLKAPDLRGLRVAKKSFKSSTSLKYSTNERGTISADYYRLDKKGKRHFRGWDEWKSHVGINSAKFGGKAKHFRKRTPGSYEAVIRATDEANNSTKAKRLKFTIKG